MILLDPNPNVLARTSRRLAAMHPTVIEADVMKPLPVGGPFDSAAINYVLHRLRGPQPNKAVAIRNIATVLAPDGVLFGGTVLGTAERHTRSARAVLWAFNREGSFDNLGDTADGFRVILDESFRSVEVDVIGSVAHFTAIGPRRYVADARSFDLLICSGVSSIASSREGPAGSQQTAARPDVDVRIDLRTTR